MNIVNLDENLHEEWEKFCIESDDAWFWHTIEWSEFILNLNPSLGSKCASFFVKEKKDIIAVVPLFIETKTFKDKKINELSFGGGQLPMPALRNNLSENDRHKIFQYIFENVDVLSKNYNALKASYKSSPLAPLYVKPKHPQSNFLARYSFIDVSSASRIIDLQEDEKALWDGLRRNHRRGVNEMRDDFEIIVYDKNNITHEIFDEYRLMHKKAAGRVTRPLITFEKMYQWIREGLAILVASENKVKKNRIGFEYYGSYKNCVYGFSAANDPEYSNFPVRHLIEWEAMLWLKGRGFKYYEIGSEYYGPHLHYFPSDKEVNISRFKQGFGGFAVPLFLGEKYYSREYFEEIMKERVQNYSERYSWI